MVSESCLSIETQCHLGALSGLDCIEQFPSFRGPRVAETCLANMPSARGPAGSMRSSVELAKLAVNGSDDVNWREVNCSARNYGTDCMSIASTRQPPLMAEPARPEATGEIAFSVDLPCTNQIRIRR